MCIQPTYYTINKLGFSQCAGSIKCQFSSSPYTDMDLMRHSSNAHGGADFAHRYGPLDFVGNHHHHHHHHRHGHHGSESEQHNAYWQWQHSDGSSSEGFGHQRPTEVHGADDRHILHRWDATGNDHSLRDESVQLDTDEFTAGLLLQQSPPLHRPKNVVDWNRSCFECVYIIHILVIHSWKMFKRPRGNVYNNRIIFIRKQIYLRNRILLQGNIRQIKNICCFAKLFSVYVVFLIKSRDIYRFMKRTELTDIFFEHKHIFPINIF